MPTLQQQLQPRARLPGEEGEMSDEELGKHCMCGCIYLEAECPNCNRVTDADRIEALIEQLAAARQDAEEAEAYAEELEKELNTCRMAQAVMDNTVADLEAKLTKAVALLIEASTDLTAYVDADYPPESCVRYPDIARRHHRDLELVRRIDAAIAEIKGESHE